MLIFAFCDLIVPFKFQIVEKRWNDSTPSTHKCKKIFRFEKQSNEWCVFSFCNMINSNELNICICSTCLAMNINLLISDDKQKALNIQKNSIKIHSMNNEQQWTIYGVSKPSHCIGICKHMRLFYLIDALELHQIVQNK